MAKAEYELYTRNEASELECLLNPQRHCWRSRIYQLDFDGEQETIPSALMGIKAPYKANYTQSPAVEYRLMYEDTLICPADMPEERVLDYIFSRYSGKLPEYYHGCSLAPSDVAELYDQGKRSYFYRDKGNFVPVNFSLFLAKPMKETN